jgi:hypothetical protein
MSTEQIIDVLDPDTLLIIGRKIIPSEEAAKMCYLRNEKGICGANSNLRPCNFPAEACQAVIPGVFKNKLKNK